MSIDDQLLQFSPCVDCGHVFVGSDKVHRICHVPPNEDTFKCDACWGGRTQPPSRFYSMKGNEIDLSRVVSVSRIVPGFGRDCWGHEFCILFDAGGTINHFADRLTDVISNRRGLITAWKAYAAAGGAR